MNHKKIHVILITKDHLVTATPPIDIDGRAHTMMKNALLFVTMLQK
jgi:hypothetical protein